MISQITESQFGMLSRSTQVGLLSTPQVNRKFTVDELRRSDSIPVLPGRVDKEILIAINGNI
jgi:hypothetical protein